MLYNPKYFPFTKEEVKSKKNIKQLTLSEGLPISQTEIAVLLPISVEGDPVITIGKMRLKLDLEALYYLDIDLPVIVNQGDASLLYFTIDPTHYPDVLEYRETHQFLVEENLPKRGSETDEYVRRVFKVISKGLKVPESSITLESDLRNDLGADSLDTVNLVLFLQDEFQLDQMSLPKAEVLESLTTVGSIIELLDPSVGLMK